jgi:hypothetical protein
MKAACGASVLLFCSLFAIGSLQSQDDNTKLGVVLDKTMEAIKKAQKQFPESVLKADRAVIMEVYPDLRKIHAKEKVPITGPQSMESAGVAWYKIRAVKEKNPAALFLPATKPLTAQVFVTQAQRLCCLPIESDPVDATVLFNKIKRSPTNTFVWEYPGTYEIHLEKDGYKPVDDVVDLKGPGMPPRFFSTLKKN